MVNSVYNASGEEKQEALLVGDENFYADVVTVAQTYYPNQKLTKTFYRDSVKQYDQVKTFNFYEYEVMTLYELATLVKRVIVQPRCCLLRSRSKDKSKWVLRRFNGVEATLVEQPQHWFALDIDGYGVATGDVENDAKSVLLALGWGNVECIALASSSYGIKSDIRMRLFFWANRAVESIVLKKFMMNNKVCADLALFHPIQPIYVATPLFLDGLVDPVEKRLVWIDGDFSCVDIPWHIVVEERRARRLSTKKQAVAYIRDLGEQVMQAEQGSRHSVLFQMSSWAGSLVGQELLDEEETIEYLLDCCRTWGEGDRKKDQETIRDGIRNGVKEIEGQL